MKKNILLFLLLASDSLNAQDFDFYGPEPFGEILEDTFNKT